MWRYQLPALALLPGCGGARLDGAARGQPATGTDATRQHRLTERRAHPRSTVRVTGTTRAS